MRIILVATLICMALAVPRARQIQKLSNENRIAGEFLVVLGTPSFRTNNEHYANTIASKISEISSEIVIVKRFTNLRTPILLVKTTKESVIANIFQLNEVESIEANVLQKMTLQCTTQYTGS